MIFKSHDESIAHERNVHQGQQKPGGQTTKIDGKPSKAEKEELNEKDELAE